MLKINAKNSLFLGCVNAFQSSKFQVGNSVYSVYAKATARGVEFLPIFCLHRN